MPNMSYCRFENTSNDMQECIEALEESNWDLKVMMENASSEYEARGMMRFIELCQQVVDVRLMMSVVNGLGE